MVLGMIKVEDEGGVGDIDLSLDAVFVFRGVYSSGGEYRYQIDYFYRLAC